MLFFYTLFTLMYYLIHLGPTRKENLYFVHILSLALLYTTIYADKGTNSQEFSFRAAANRLHPRRIQ